MLSPNMLHVGVAVRLLRVSQRLTIPQLAHEASCNPKTISKIERGESNCTVAILGAIAKALGVPNAAALDARLDEWCEQRIGGRKIKSEWREWIALLETLSVDPEAQRVVLGLLRFEARQVRRVSSPDQKQHGPQGRQTRRRSGVVERDDGNEYQRTPGSSTSTDLLDDYETRSAQTGTQLRRKRGQ